MSSEANAVLDRLEAELFREARQHLEPDQARIERLWQGLAASALGAAVGGAAASAPPVSGTWAAPRPVTPSPSAAPSTEGAIASHAAAAPTPSEPPSAVAPTSLQNAGLLQRLGQASFGLRALLGAAVGGALLGFAVGRSSGHGSSGSAEKPLQRSARATLAASSTAASNASDAHRATADFTSGVELGSLPPEEPLTRPLGPTTKPEIGALGALPSSGEPGSAQPGSASSDPSENSSEPTEKPPTPSFYEELQYLKRAQAALREGNGALALGLVTSLDAIQPGGALLSERGVVQVLAHCQLGDVESAERVAERLAAQGLGSVYTERLETSCAGAVFSKP